MKTNREWLMMMDEPERSQAIDNAEKSIPNTLNDYYANSVGMAIGGSFSWIETPQGHEYWERIAAKYRNR